MTAKEYLQQIYILSWKIRRLKRRRDDLYADLYSLGSPMGKLDSDRVQTSMSGDTIPKLISRIDKINRRLDREVDALEAKKEKIIKQIEALPDEQHRNILYHRYVMLWKWEAIAKDMQMAERWVYVLHGKALKAFAERYKIDQ